ncbi:MAG: inosine/xanthosine triphosphatase [Xanthomonadales bacterium]|nr:inosine/xanthosine triphosphatase [Xanthomonadales bacterium]
MLDKAVKVIVTSHNPVKIAAVREAFAVQFPGSEMQVIPLAVESGVADQPMSDAETRQGALNRVANARREAPAADFWVGLEGGLDLFDGRLVAFAWMAVASRDGRDSQTRSVTLPLPPRGQKRGADGLELGDANDRVFSTLNSKQGGGAFGLLTDGLMTRESIYTQTLILALVPYVHDLWS